MTAAQAKKNLVGIVIVSHSHHIANGTVELAQQMAADVTIVAAGGTDDNEIGTSFSKVMDAFTQADSGAGVVCVTDLGSAVLTAESALEFLDEEQQARIAIPHAPLVEGAIAAATTAQQGLSVEVCTQAAVYALNPEDAPADGTLATAGSAGAGSQVGTSDADGNAGQTGLDAAAGQTGLDVQARQAGLDSQARQADADAQARQADSGAQAKSAGPDTQAGTSDADDSTTGQMAASVDGTSPATMAAPASLQAKVEVLNKAGIHARPAAKLSAIFADHGVTATINGVNASSVMMLMTLSLPQGSFMNIEVTGENAQAALDAVIEFADNAFGEER